MNNEIWQKNKAALKKNQTHISEIIPLIEEASVSGEILVTRQGLKTARIANKWLYSKIDPEKEVLKFIDSQRICEGDFVVCYGFALGYHIRKILSVIGSRGYVYVVELNFDLLKTAFFEMDCSDILSSQNFKLISHFDQFELAKMFDHYVYWNWDEIPTEQKKIVIHSASFELIPSEFDIIKNSLLRIKMEREGDNVFATVIKSNLKHNLPGLEHAAGFKNLSIHHPNIPVIVVGAGPSLDCAIPLIQNIKNTVFIMAVDSALKPLSRAGIRPDFIVSVDPQDKTFEHFKVSHEYMAPVIGYPTLSPRLFALNMSFIPVVQAKSFVSEYFGSVLPAHWGETKGGSSVSVIAVDLACQIFKGPIILTGMDFSFPDLNGYAHHTTEKEFWYSLTSPYHNIDTVSMEYIYSKTPVKLTDKMGRFILTFQSLISYKITLETIIASMQPKAVFTYGDRGLPIKHTQEIVFEEELLELVKNSYPKTYALNQTHMTSHEWRTMMAKCALL